MEGKTSKLGSWASRTSLCCRCWSQLVGSRLVLIVWVLVLVDYDSLILVSQIWERCRLCFIEFSAGITCDKFPIRLPAWLRLLRSKVRHSEHGCASIDGRFEVVLCPKRSPVVRVEVGALVWKPYYQLGIANG